MPATTSEHLSSFGTKVEYSTNLTVPSYTELTDVKSVTPPGLEIGEPEDTHLQSTAATREFGAGGWVKVTDLTITLYAVATQDAALKALIRTMVLWRITLPRLSSEASAGKTYVGRGFIKSITPTAQEVGSEERYTKDYVITMSGVVTETAGS